jgi:hypothetical protein
MVNCQLSTQKRKEEDRKMKKENLCVPLCIFVAKNLSALVPLWQKIEVIKWEKKQN